jgi:hypothetical protein
MEKKRSVAKYTSGYGTGDISLKSLVFYNLLFFIPMILLILLSSFIGTFLSRTFHTTIAITMEILMIFFTLILFAVIIPFIRRRESVIGVRYSLIGFLIVAVGLTLPSIVLEWDFSLLYIELPHIATYFLLTFIYCPEVLGMDIDISNWFKHFKQIMIIVVYCCIVLFYVSGFGWIFFNMAQADPGAFVYSIEKPLSYSMFLYFSIISFATIGYGDIIPVTTGARFLVCVEAIVGSIVNVIFIAILFVYVSNFQSFIRGVREEKKLIEIEGEEKLIKRKEEKILRTISPRKKKSGKAKRKTSKKKR